MKRRQPTHNVVKVALTLTVQVAHDVLRKNIGDIALAIGPHLATQVDDYVQREQLGYYPALNYFNLKLGIDKDLLLTAEEVGSLVCEIVRQQIRLRLRPLFSSVRIEQTQAVAFSMPHIRVQDQDAIDALARHYSPDVTRVSLIITSLEKLTPTKGYEKLIGYKIKRGLKDHFGSIHVVSSRII